MILKIDGLDFGSHQKARKQVGVYDRDFLGCWNLETRENIPRYEGLGQDLELYTQILGGILHMEEAQVTG